MKLPDLQGSLREFASAGPGRSAAKRQGRASPPARLRSFAVQPFDVARTLESGQVFHAIAEGRGWRMLVDCTPLYVEQKEGGVRVSAEASELAAHYFALDHSLEEVYAAFPEDDFSRAALAACRGIRILRQPKWECLATFILSPMKKVSHIRQMSLRLRERFGERIPGSPLNRFPTARRLARTSEADLRACGLGFRAGKLLESARMVARRDIDLDALAAENTPDVREALLRLPGVGRKVANCVLLFAYERLEAVPVDVWMARILRAMLRRPATLKELEEFSLRQFGSYAGYVQQYLFHHARSTGTLPAA